MARRTRADPMPSPARLRSLIRKYR
jgi:hypothetical protein